MKPSEILEKAKDNLVTTRDEPGERSQYICNAVKLATGYYEPSANRNFTPAAKKVINHINHLLNGKPTLDVWIGVYHPRIKRFSNFDKLQRTRLAWIDNMIAYFKAKGQ